MKVATGDLRMESSRPDRRARGVFYPNRDPLAEPGRQAAGR